MRKEIKDIIELSKHKEANIEALLESSFGRGIDTGKETFRITLLSMLLTEKEIKLLNKQK